MAAGSNGKIATTRQAPALRLVPGGSDASPSDHVDLSLPARPDSLQMVRLAAGFVAARAMLDYDELHDLRLAIDELCSLLLEPADDGWRTMALRCTWAADTVELTCTVGEPLESGDIGALSALCATVSGRAASMGVTVDGFDGRVALSRLILAALVDEHVVVSGEGRQVGWLRWRRIEVGR